ncbi:hypothetical protein BDW60DRAFT_206885 [Aspergillus nidulans var. acristatus]
MGLFQPKITPLPRGIDLTGKTSVITGATAGLGLETARQLLRLKVSTLVLAVRNTEKAQSCVAGLLRDPDIQARSTRPDIHVLKCDMEHYSSVKSFSAKLKESIPGVDILILNAGIHSFNYEKASDGHEKALQVNYLSNVLLLAELLPYLESTAERTGSAVRITWLGSRTYYLSNSLEKSDILTYGGGILQYMDSEKAFASAGMNQYSDRKLLCALFVYELASRLNRDKVILNLVCPGMVKTDLGSNGPLWIRMLISIVKTLRARPVEVGGWLVLNAAVAAGRESHGSLIGDKEVTEPTKFIKSSAGQELQKRLWKETVEEMATLTELPSAFV